MNTQEPDAVTQKYKTYLDYSLLQSTVAYSKIEKLQKNGPFPFGISPKTANEGHMMQISSFVPHLFKRRLQQSIKESTEVLYSLGWSTNTDQILYLFASSNLATQVFRRLVTRNIEPHKMKKLYMEIDKLTTRDREDLGDNRLFYWRQAPPNVHDYFKIKFTKDEVEYLCLTDWSKFKQVESLALGLLDRTVDTLFRGFNVTPTTVQPPIPKGGNCGSSIAAQHDHGGVSNASSFFPLEDVYPSPVNHASSQEVSLAESTLNTQKSGGLNIKDMPSHNGPISSPKKQRRLPKEPKQKLRERKKTSGPLEIRE